MLSIKNLKVNREGLEILKGISLNIKKGETHVLMGPNGSGKSTLANSLMANPDYEVTSGSIVLNQSDITKLDVSERAKKGLFLAFQYPVEVPGVPLIQFLKLAYTEKTGTSITPGAFLKLINEVAKDLDIKQSLLDRYLNEGFSGGEKKKIEILQMAVLNPEFVILDETDSGLDVTALKTIFKYVNQIKISKNMGVLVVTHYSRILEFLKPDFVHIMKEGKLVKSGGIELAEEIEKDGYKTLVDVN
ncbi:Fe-S cluster assembly ATPase SufC [bacterium]|nr:Fe-S cluster assembly ATPase SufC [bacterium]